MDPLTLYTLFGFLGLGYYLNKDGRKRDDTEIKKDSIPEREKPSANDIYNSRHLEKVWGDEFKRSTKNWKDSEDPINTNIIPAAYKNRPDISYGQKIIQREKSLRKSKKKSTEPSSTRTVKAVSDNLLKKKGILDYGTKTYNQRRRRLAPISKKIDDDVGNWKTVFKHKPRTVRNPNDFSENNIGVGGKTVIEHMYHNNMEPFFGGTAKQNVDPDAYRPTLETYTGTDPTYSHKKEIGRFFPVEKNPFVNGLPVQSNRELERYIPSNLGLKTSQLPFEQVRVPPGLNEDAKKLKSNIGFHDMYRPTFKTVNELRVNPKSNYKGRITGEKFFIPGREKEQPVISRRSVDLSFTNDPTDKSRRYRPIVKETLGGIQRPTDLNPKSIIFKNAERDHYAHRLADHGGPGIAETKKPTNIAKVRVSNKPTFKRQIIAPKAEITRDYNVPDIRVSNRPTYRIKERFVTKSRDAGQQYHSDLALTTIKEQTSPATHSHINIGTYDEGQRQPYDLSRTTIKQQTVNRKASHINIGTYKKRSVYDKDDWMAKTTIKEQTSGKNVTANVDGRSQGRGTTQLFDDARTTIKEQIAGKNVTANVDGRNVLRNKTQPFDDARITSRQQLAGKNVTANVDGNASFRNTTNPFDDARITIKEQTSGKNVTANVDGNNQHRNVTNPFDDARVTIKQQTFLENYKGTVNSSSNAQQQTSRQNMYNAEINALKELTIQGREPAEEGPKLIPDKTLYNIESTNIQYDTYEKSIRIGKIWDPPSFIRQRITAQKNLYCDHDLLKDRINPEILDAYKKNPFTQSLQSHARQYNPRAKY